MVGIAILCFLYAPLLTLLRAPPTKEEKKVSIVGVVGGIENGGLTLDNDKPVVQTVLGGAGSGGEPKSTQDPAHTRPATPIGNAAAQESYTTKL